MEHGGFYRTTDQAWVTMERIQFVGACNPPTDPGRKPLSHRLVFVLFPPPPPPQTKKLSTLDSEINGTTGKYYSVAFI